MKLSLSSKFMITAAPASLFARAFGRQRPIGPLKIIGLA